MLELEETLDQHPGSLFYQWENSLPGRNNISKATQLVNYWFSDKVTIWAQQRIVNIYPSIYKTQDETDTFDYTTAC